MVDLSNYYCGGYFLICADKPDWEALQTPQFPDKLISLSECICPQRLCVWWGWEPGDREAALKFGIPAGKLDEFVEWCRTTSEIDHPSMFYSADAARHFVERFIPDSRHVYLIGVGFHKQLKADALGGTGEKEQPSIRKQVEQHLPLDIGGTVLGFEVVSGFHYNFSHSWLCSGLEVDMRELFGVETGQFGLIQTQPEAKQVYEWIAEDGQRGRRGEPEPYAYWLLVSYSLR